MERVPSGLTRPAPAPDRLLCAPDHGAEITALVQRQQRAWEGKVLYTENHRSTPSNHIFQGPGWTCRPRRLAGFLGVVEKAWTLFILTDGVTAAMPFSLWLFIKPLCLFKTHFPYL